MKAMIADTTVPDAVMMAQINSVDKFFIISTSCGKYITTAQTGARTKGGVRELELIIRGDLKEIAALVFELQELREVPYEIKTALDVETVIASALEAIRGKPGAEEG